MQLSNDELVLQAEKEIKVERESTLRIIKLFQEISVRKIYLERGYPSFYEMVTKHFGYCAGSAMRRINAMKLVKEMPQFEEKIESGELSLSVAADVQSFLYQEAKIERPYSLNAKIELVETCLGKSRREVEEEFARRNPEREKRETQYAISNERLRVSFSISKELNDKFNHLKDLLGHVDPSMTTESLLERLAEVGLDKYDPARKATRAAARKIRMRKKSGQTESSQALERSGSSTEVKDSNPSTPLPTSAAEVKRTRYINVRERYEVEDDGQGCTFVSKSGHRCGSKRFLQLDHVQPFARGGANSRENLRWMCGSHNRGRATDNVESA